MRRFRMGKFIVAFALSASFLVACSDDVNQKLGDAAQEVVDQVNNVTDSVDPNVLGVKNGSPNSHPSCSYGDVFDEFFSSPTWKYFKATSGEKVVEFTGYCMYQDVKVKARLQFILNKDGKTFETGALSFNDVPQSKLITISVIYKAFSDYIKNHNIKEDTNLEEKDLEDIFATDSNTDTLDDTDSATYKQQNSSVNEGSYEGKEDEEASQDGEYIIPQSSSVYLEYNDLPSTKEYLRLARNEIFARHGRIFKDKELQEYFESTSWYVPTTAPEDFNENVLNEFEKYNVALIKEAEKNLSE